MAGQFMIAAVQHRVPVIGLAHPGLGVVGDQLLRAAAEIGEGADMGPQPILLPLGPGRLGVDEVGARQTGDKDLRLSGDAGIDHRQRHPGPIDFERFRRRDAPVASSPTRDRRLGADRSVPGFIG